MSDRAWSLESGFSRASTASSARHSGLLLGVGALLCLGVQVGARAVHYAGFVHPRMPAMAEDIAAPLEPMKVDPSWVLEGSPKFFSHAYFTSPDGGTTSGIWACDGPGRFQWRHDTDESVYILEGEAFVDYEGVTHTLHPGDVTFFKAGTTTTWRVPLHVRKSFTLNNPGRVTRWLRRVL